MKYFFCWSFLLLSAQVFSAQKMTVQFEIPVLDVNPYHRPYVAVWIEDAERRGVESLSVWYEGDKWLKDMRQWWRKLGRTKAGAYDGVTGATQRPARYQISWNGTRWNKTQTEKIAVEPGEYFVNIEVAREAGGRDFLRQKISWRNGQPQKFVLNGKVELGSVQIHVE